MVSRSLSPPPERVPWAEWFPRWRWEQGEHIALITDTGGGKSTLMRAISPKRGYNVLLSSKVKDDTYSRMLDQDWKRIKNWPPPPYSKGHKQKLILWPEYRKLEDTVTKGGPLFKKTLNHIFTDLNWTVYLDDLYYLCQEMGLAKEVKAINFQVRSMGISLVSGLQRPSWVPRSAWNQTKHSFVSGLTDDEDIKTLRGLAQVPLIELREWLKDLDDYEWLYLPKRKSSGRPVILRPPAPWEPLPPG